MSAVVGEVKRKLLNPSLKDPCVLPCSQMSRKGCTVDRISISPQLGTLPIHRLIRQGSLRLGGTAPKRGNQPAVAKLLGISVAELVSGGTNVGSGVDVRRQRVPLVSEVVAGNYTVIDNFQRSPATT